MPTGSTGNTGSRIRSRMSSITGRGINSPLFERNEGGREMKVREQCRVHLNRRKLSLFHLNWFNSYRPVQFVCFPQPFPHLLIQVRFLFDDDMMGKPAGFWFNHLFDPVIIDSSVQIKRQGDAVFRTLLYPEPAEARPMQTLSLSRRRPGFS